MTGFIRGLFGQKDDNEPKEAFFLDADSASTLGDVNFMKKSKTVKRSYPKAAGKLNMIEGETEKAVSSMQKRESGAETQTASSSSTSSFSTSTSSSTQSSTFQPTPVKPRTVSNTNDGIDFKSMARDIKKKR